MDPVTANWTTLLTTVPPKTTYITEYLNNVQHPELLWPLFIAMSVLGLAMILFGVWKWIKVRRRNRRLPYDSPLSQ